MKTLLRSWFFRIFAFAGLFIITIFNIAMLLADGPRWNMRAVSSVIPYTNMMMLNIAQSIIIAFLATEFMKRDKKLDTTEVIYIRSMSNGVYILGKSVGTLVIFLMLNLLVLIVTGVINVLMEGVAFNWAAYLIYPLIMSLPTLLFIMGLSYVLMLTLRNQAVTFVVLLGYIAACLFYLNDKFNYVFDYMAFSLPMLQSEFVGFANPEEVLMQRGIYFLLGLGFVFLTILLIGRLRQSRTMTFSSTGIAAIFILSAGFLIARYIGNYQDSKDRRTQMIAVEADYVDRGNVSVNSYDIELEHLGEQIRVSSGLEVSNPGTDLDGFFLLLNPGLNVKSITVDGEPADYTREFQVIWIDRPMKSNTTARIVMEYEGEIDKDAMYLDIDEELIDLTYRVAIYSVGKEYHFLSPEYLLLTQEAKWYPVSRIPFSEEKGIMNPQQFSKYRLKVKTSEGLLAVSQGQRSEVSPGVYEFTPEYPLPQISLMIGDYTERSIRVDSVDYNLVLKSDHYYFDDFFENITDTLTNTLREIKNDYELELQLDYPYKRFSVIETPAMFVSFPRIYSQAKEVMQPEMSLLPEKGMALVNADFQFRRERLIDRNKQRGGDLTDQEIEAQLLRQFVTSTLTIANQNNWFSEGDGASFTSSYSIFPSYYSYVNFVTSEDWPFFNKAFESFLWERVSPGNRRRWYSATTIEEDATIALKEKSFKQILIEEEDELINSVIGVKGNYLFSMVKQEVKSDEFDSRVIKFLKESQFRSVTDTALERAVFESDEGFLRELVNKTVVSNQLPGFLISGVNLFSFKDGDRTRYAARYIISNTQEIDGLVQLTFRMGGGRGAGGGRGDFAFDGGFGGQRGGNNANSIEQLVKIPAASTMEFTTILDEEPRALNVNTIMALNLPRTINFPFEETEESEGTFSEQSVRLDDRGTLTENGIIVDDEDPGFSVTEGEQSTPLRALIKGEQLVEESTYYPMMWRRPGKWTPTISQWAYGNEVRSAYFIGSGDGSEVATWECELEEGAYYDVYVHLNNRMRWGRRDEEPVDDYHYTVHSDDGETEITVELKNIVNGWNSLGSYYISPGKAKVELTNKSRGRSVIADAVKWVKR